MGQLISMKGVSLICDLPAEPLFAVCDADKITQVIINLLDNALKFTEKGGKITLRLQERNGEITIKVSDTGTGIQEEDQVRIFNIFEQGRPDKKKKGSGFGIGLAICRKILEEHQGKIVLESVYGHGAHFTATFPANLNPSPEGAAH